MLSIAGIFGCAKVLVFFWYDEICRYFLGYAKIIIIIIFFFFFFLSQGCSQAPVAGKSQINPAPAPTPGSTDMIENALIYYCKLLLLAPYYYDYDLKANK